MDGSMKSNGIALNLPTAVYPIAGLGVGLAIGFALDKAFGWGIKGYIGFALVGFLVPAAVVIRSNSMQNTAKAKGYLTNPLEEATKLAQQTKAIIDKIKASGVPNDTDMATIKNTIIPQMTALGYTYDVNANTGQPKVIPGGPADGRGAL